MVVALPETLRTLTYIRRRLFTPILLIGGLSMFITGLGTATPPHCYTQVQCWEALQAAPQFALLDRRARTTLQRVLLRDNGIRTRYLALEALAEIFATDPDTLQRRFALHAPALAHDAA